MAEQDQTLQSNVGASGDGQPANPDEKVSTLLGGGADDGAGDGDGDSSILEGDKGRDKDILDDGEEPEGAPEEPEGAPEEPEGAPEEPEGAPEEPEGAPEEYKPFDIPEGMTLNEAALEKAQPLFKELGLDQAKAQKAVSMYAELVQEGVSEQKKAFDTVREGWVKEIKSDPDHPKMLANGKKAVEAFADDATKQLLFGEWLGDHPGLNRMLGKIGAAMQNDSFVEGGSSGGQKEAPEALFDDMPGMSK